MSRWLSLQSQLPLDPVHGCNPDVRDLGDFFHRVSIPLEQARYFVPLRLITHLARWLPLRFRSPLVLQTFPSPLHSLLLIEACHGHPQVWVFDSASCLSFIIPAVMANELTSSVFSTAMALLCASLEPLNLAIRPFLQLLRLRRADCEVARSARQQWRFLNLNGLHGYRP